MPEPQTDYACFQSGSCCNVQNEKDCIPHPTVMTKLHFCAILACKQSETPTT